MQKIFKYPYAGIQKQDILRNERNRFSFLLLNQQTLITARNKKPPFPKSSYLRETFTGLVPQDFRSVII